MAALATLASHRVFRHALKLHDDLQHGLARDFDREQAALTNLVLDTPDGPVDGPDRGARYALVCWLDELFTCQSPWSAEWNEQKLESTLYGSNDRAWEFWRQAKLAAARPTDDVLSVYFLCVALGFRGEMRNRPEQLASWVERTRSRVARVSPRGATPRGNAARRGGRRPQRGTVRMRRFLAVACAASLVILPVATYAVMQRLLG